MGRDLLAKMKVKLLPLEQYYYLFLMAAKTDVEVRTDGTIRSGNCPSGQELDPQTREFSQENPDSQTRVRGTETGPGMGF